MDFTKFASRRSVVHSAKGMAASTQPLATAAAIKILEQGGNAAMAAVALASSMGVVEPMMTGMGGDAFCLYYDAKTGKVSGLNGSGQSGKDMNLDLALSVATSSGCLPESSALTVNVPGAVAAWVDIVEKWGNGAVPFSELLKPAIDLAENGFPVSSVAQYMWENATERLKASSPNGNELLIDGRAPKVGELFRNANMASVLRRVADKGKAGFYEGPVADSIIDTVRGLCGVLKHQDLESHCSLFLPCVSVPLSDGVVLHELPPNNQGLVALLAANTINCLVAENKLDLKGLKHNSAEYIHALVESLKFAFADAAHYVTDPHQMDYSVEQLLSAEFSESRAKLYSKDQANAEYEHGALDGLSKSDTSYFTVVDAEGNACSMIASIFGDFGSCIVPKGCGFALHNRALNFSLQEGSRNVIAGGKRPYHTIIPAMLTKGDQLYAAYGVMGGFMQPQGHLQVALNMINFGLDPQESLDAPRFCIAPAKGRAVPCNKFGVLVNLEQGIPEETVEGLKALGHNVKIVTGDDRCIFGRGQVIQQEISHGRRVLHGGSDPRGDGHAVPQV